MPDHASAPVVVVAEAGINHNGSLDRARAMVRAAAECGADFVKFQTFKAEKSITPNTAKVGYQKASTGSGDQLDMVKPLELPFEAFRVLAVECQKCSIGFASTPFDDESADFLNDIGVPWIKIPSGEITNAPLLLHIARFGRPVVMSTGMATLEDIERALGVLAYGYSSSRNVLPSEADFAAAFRSADGKAALMEKVTLLHCTSEYPAPLEHVNLRAMGTIADTFGLPVGYSDHTVGIVASLAAAARGAVLIEKHFTLDRSLPGPDHGASLEPAELAQLVSGVRDVTRALGSDRKVPTPTEVETAALMRKSLVAVRAIAAGEPLTTVNLGVLRPGTGISAFRYWSLLGTPAPRALKTGELL